MASSDELSNERQKYYNLKEDIKTLIKNLQTSFNDLDNAANIKNYFSIDKESADGGKIVASRNKISNIINYLKTQVLPQIDSNIDSLGIKIEEAEEKEEAESED